MQDGLKVLLLASATGLAGAFTPCALGINTILVGALSGRSRVRRLAEWALFAGARASVLMALGLLLGLVGQALGQRLLIFQQVVNIAMIALGVLLIISRFRPIAWPGINLAPRSWLNRRQSIAMMGVIFGLDFTACILPLILALLAQTVAIGHWVVGGASLFVFGIALSLPALAVTFIDGADLWLQRMAHSYNRAFYIAAGALLILFGAAEFLLTLTML